MSIVAVTSAEPSPLWLLPFVALLGCIALAPVILRSQWERHYYKVCLSLSALVCGYYLFGRHDHGRVVRALGEYASFIVVVGSFYVVAGGIHLRARSHSRPVPNTVFLFLGALLANIVGTIGASLVLIRPWIEMNKTRFAGFHLAFFIFIVSNIGGSLLPVGPPLLLGYTTGVPFFWPLSRLWAPWLVGVGFLLFVFYLIDRNQSRDMVTTELSPTERERWRIFGKRNFILMGLLLVALTTLTPPRREILMVAAAAISFFTSPRHIHEANGFSFLPLKEVAALFFGIFGTMIPVLDLVEAHARHLGVTTPAGFFWVTGLLSAFLDNAPTYLTFFAAATGLHGGDHNHSASAAEFLAKHGKLLAGVSLGATFFGACTYIGNGPNLLIKRVADNLKMPVPSFFGFFFKYALPILAPLFVLIAVVFLRG